MIRRKRRFYHGFKSEDFVGKVSDLANACSKNYVEQVLLPRFYMGLPISASVITFDLFFAIVF